MKDFPVRLRAPCEIPGLAITINGSLNTPPPLPPPHRRSSRGSLRQSLGTCTAAGEAGSS